MMIVVGEDDSDKRLSISLSLVASFNPWNAQVYLKKIYKEMGRSCKRNVLILNEFRR